MARHKAVFGGEHSAHYYFRDFWFADTGMLAAMHVLAALGEQDGTLSELVADFSRYAASGEINSTVADAAAATAAVRQWAAAQDVDLRRARRADRDPPGASRCGGSTCAPATPSRCCGSTSRRPMRATMARVRDDVLAIVRGESR